MKRTDKSQRPRAKIAAGTLSPREDAGNLYQLFKARSPVTENLKFEKKRVPLFDAKISNP